MLKEDYNKLVVTNNIYNRGFVMHMHGTQRDVIERLSIAGDDYLLKREGWTRTCGTSSYQMFEYVGENPDYNAIIEACQEIAEIMEMELTLQINPARMPKSGEEEDPVITRIKDLTENLRAEIQNLAPENKVRHGLMVAIFGLEAELEGAQSQKRHLKNIPFRQKNDEC